jgi:SAM-dependent methyltransferase
MSNQAPSTLTALESISAEAVTGPGVGIDARFLPEVGAGGFSRYDGTIQFYARVNAILRADAVALDFGAGRGVSHIDDPVPYRRQLVRLQGKVRKLIGADVDPVVKTNPAIDEAIVIDATGRLPLADRSVDIIVSDHTFEHLEDPAVVAREFDRILAPGGWICARTPNRHGYIAIMNMVIPQALRRRTLHSAQQERKDMDVFPAFYRLNSAAALRRYFDPIHYDHFSYTWDSEPAYHFSSPAFYALFLAIHAITPPALKTLRYIFLRKKDA